MLKYRIISDFFITIKTPTVKKFDKYNKICLTIRTMKEDLNQFKSFEFKLEYANINITPNNIT